MIDKRIQCPRILKISFFEYFIFIETIGTFSLTINPSTGSRTGCFDTSPTLLTFLFVLCCPFPKKHYHSNGLVSFVALSNHIAVPVFSNVSFHVVSDLQPHPLLSLTFQICSSQLTRQQPIKDNFSIRDNIITT